MNLIENIYSQVYMLLIIYYNNCFRHVSVVSSGYKVNQNSAFCYFIYWARLNDWVKSQEVIYRTVVWAPDLSKLRTRLQLVFTVWFSLVSNESDWNFVENILAKNHYWFISPTIHLTKQTKGGVVVFDIVVLPL